MKLMKRALALAFAGLLCVGILSGCGEQTQKNEGMDLSVCLGGEPETLDPARVSADADVTVLEQLYENLMRITPDSSGEASVANGMAKSYDTETNYDGSVTYTFRLRSAKWSDGVEVKAGDFVYAWQRLVDPASAMPNAQMLSMVVGYDEVQSTGDVTKLRVEAKNDATLVVTLNGVCPWFLTDVCTAAATMPLRQDIVEKLTTTAGSDAAGATFAAASVGEGTSSAVEQPEEKLDWTAEAARLVTNGAYVVDAMNSQSLLLKSSATYTGTTSGPASIRFLFAETPEDAWALYEAGTVDFAAPLPETELAALAAESENWMPTTELNTVTLLFNTQAEPFTDPTIRQAFSLTVDRAAACETAGLGTQAAGGLVPYGVPESEEGDFRTSSGNLMDADETDYPADCIRARALMEQSGYDSAFSFPDVSLLYEERGSNAAVAAGLAEMWSQQLHIKVTTEGLDAETLDTRLHSGEYLLAMADIRGRANDPECFLEQWASDSTDNVIHYDNNAYNTLLSVIQGATDETARIGCLHDAESLLIEECPLSPLYYTGTAWKLRDGLTGVCRDARGWFSFEMATVATVTP
jgi:oligopeptide transport system substrate-binding protein